MDLIRILLDLVFPPRERERLVRDATPSSIKAHVAPVTFPNGRIALMPYRTSLVAAAITEAKFKGNEGAERLLASVLADYLAKSLTSEARTVLVPIPLSKERLRARGYNQTERIASLALQEAPSLSLGLVLERTRDTVPQTSLGRRARLRNVTGAFRTRLPIDPTYTYIVFDDVSTTGATLAAAQKALSEAGARRVRTLSLAH